MRRILVLGCSGAGKSTLARSLARMTGLPLIDLDGIHWRYGWTAPPTEEWRKIVAAAAAAQEWIMDGNYTGTFDLRMPRADTVIWLDYPRRICLWRVAKRTAGGYGHTREGLPPGCPERLDWDFCDTSGPSTRCTGPGSMPRSIALAPAAGWFGWTTTAA